MAHDAEYMGALAEKLAAPPPGKGGVLFQNIQRGISQSASLSGGSQTLLSKPSVKAALAAKARMSSIVDARPRMCLIYSLEACSWPFRGCPHLLSSHAHAVGG